MRRGDTAVCGLGLIVLAMLLCGCSGQAPAGGTDPAGSGAAKTGRSGGYAGDGAMRDEDFSGEYRRGVTLVYYTQAGCPSCTRQDPLYSDAIGRLPRGASAVKMYPHMVDLNRYNVRDLPTLVVYRDGREVKRFVGVTGADRLVGAVRAAQ